jgi:hypothetical protein
MFSFSKQPKEVIVGVGIDFSARIDPIEVLTLLEVTIELLSGLEGTLSPLAVTNKALTGSVASVTIGGGYDGCVYKLTYTVNGTLGSVLESEIKLKIKEI